jgi:lipopolysaccharide export system protein LptC
MNIAAKYPILFPIALLAMLALLTFWINESVQPPTPKLDGSSRHDPDYIITNFETTQTDITGALRYKLSAAEMRHFPDDDSTLLQDPIYIQFAIDKPYTKVEGKRGEMSHKGDVVEIFDNVKVTREAFAEKGEMTLETDYLNVRPNEDFVSTHKPVVIRQAPNTVIYAIGMEHDKKKQTTTLLNRVRAHYEKPAVRANANAQNKAVNTTQKTIPKTMQPKKPATPNLNQDLKQNNVISPSISTPTPTTSTGRIRRSYE